jgi:hypothetical protein
VSDKQLTTTTTTTTTITTITHPLVSFKYVLPGVGVFFVLLFLLFVAVSLS